MDTSLWVGSSVAVIAAIASVYCAWRARTPSAEAFVRLEALEEDWTKEKENVRSYLRQAQQEWEGWHGKLRSAIGRLDKRIERSGGKEAPPELEEDRPITDAELARRHFRD